MPDHPLRIAVEKKEFLNQKDDSTNPGQRLALKGWHHPDISLFENWEIVWAKVSRGNFKHFKKTRETTRN